MTNWEKFELNCTDYLNKKFGKYANFYHQGGSNSTMPDIKVITNKNNTFFIEAKLSHAQCGQFVLTPDVSKNKFNYSSKNVSEINDFSVQIIDKMNENFDFYNNAGTAGKKIMFNNCENVFYNWVIKTYKDKNANFLITTNNIIFPIEKFDEYFEISAKYRVKKSGSRSISNKMFDKIIDAIKIKFQINHIEHIDGKKYVVSSNALDKTKFLINEAEFMFVKRNNVYDIRRLSNTFNSNVIFSIKLKKDKFGMEDLDFISYLNN